MILPNKHLSTRNSIIGIGGIILGLLHTPQTVTRLWEICSRFDEIGTFDRFTLALDFLFSIGAVDFSDENLLRMSHR